MKGRRNQAQRAYMFWCSQEQCRSAHDVTTKPLRCRPAWCPDPLHLLCSSRRGARMQARWHAAQVCGSTLAAQAVSHSRCSPATKREAAIVPIMTRLSSSTACTSSTLASTQASLTSRNGLTLSSRPAHFSCTLSEAGRHGQSVQAATEPAQAFRRVPQACPGSQKISGQMTAGSSI